MENFRNRINVRLVSNKKCIKSIMITLKISMLATQDYYSLKLIVWCMKFKPKMFMKILVRIKKCLILAVIQLSQNVIKNETAGVTIQFVIFKLLSYCFKKNNRIWRKGLVYKSCIVASNPVI